MSALLTGFPLSWALLSLQKNFIFGFTIHNTICFSRAFPLHGILARHYLRMYITNEKHVPFHFLLDTTETEYWDNFLYQDEIVIRSMAYRLWLNILSMYALKQILITKVTHLVVFLEQACYFFCVYLLVLDFTSLYFLTFHHYSEKSTYAHICL